MLLDSVYFLLCFVLDVFFFFKQKTAYEMRISDWSSDVCSSDLALADFLPAITIKAKDFANEVTNMQIKQQDLRDEPDISREHVKNNQDVRKILTDRNIQPESLPPAEDVKKVERRLKAEEKKLPKQGKALAGGEPKK